MVQWSPTLKNHELYSKQYTVIHKIPLSLKQIKKHLIKMFLIKDSKYDSQVFIMNKLCASSKILPITCTCFTIKVSIGRGSNDMLTGVIRPWSNFHKIPDWCKNVCLGQETMALLMYMATVWSTVDYIKYYYMQ